MTDETKLLPPTELSDDVQFDDEDYARKVIEAWGQPVPRDWDNDKLKFFDAVSHKPEIQALARGLTIEEALNFYGLVPNVLPEYDSLYFVATYLQGRMKGKSDAVGALFTNMQFGQGSQAVQASLAYLTRFAGAFQGEIDGGTGVKAIKIEVIE